MNADERRTAMAVEVVARLESLTGLTARRVHETATTLHVELGAVPLLCFAFTWDGESWDSPGVGLFQPRRLLEWATNAAHHAYRSYPQC